MAYNGLEEYLVPASYFGQSAGKLWVWGRNDYGQLGNNAGGAGTNLSSPVQTAAGGTNWSSISGSRSTSGGIKTDGTLWGWGKNAFGALGDNTSTNKSSPVQTITNATNWRMIACGGYHTSAIKTDGTLWTWGYNGSGSLGTGDRTFYSSPVQTIAAGTNWKQVDVANMFNGAVKTDGSLWMWGNNGNYQLGVGDFSERSSPTQIAGGGKNWKMVACGGYHGAAVKTDGTLWTWGFNSGGQLGNNSQTDTSTPVQTVAAGTNWKMVACAKGSSYTGAIKTDGTLWLWGNNNYGCLGDGTIAAKSSPVQTVAAGTNWKQVAMGAFITAAVKTDGTLWMWGKNAYGGLGNNTQTNYSSPIQTVAGGTNWKSVACGVHHVVALAI